MKKKIVALLLCVQMILVNLPPLSSWNIAWAVGNSQQQQSENSVTVESIFPESELSWKSIRDYLLDQARTAWNYPASYVGYEVSFLPYWDSIICRSDVKGGEQSIFVSLNYNSKNSEYTMDPSKVKLVIEDYYYEESTSYLWYKVKAADGYILPAVLEQNPYVMHINCDLLKDGGFDQEPPTFFIGPMKAIFVKTSGDVYFKKQAVAATMMDAVDVTQLPEILDVQLVYGGDSYGNIICDHYDLGTVAAEYTEYTYVAQEDMILIPAEASMAHNQLMNSEDSYEFYEIFRQIPESVLVLLSDIHQEHLGLCIDTLIAQEQVVRETTVNVGGVQLQVSAKGRLPDDVSLQASMVTADTVKNEGFDLENMDDLVIALDIKLISDVDGSQWQPKAGRKVTVSIGVGALGYEDGSILKMQHKHGENIETFDITVVDDGAVTIRTTGFSIYTVEEVYDNSYSNATRVSTNRPIEIEVGGEPEYFYFRINNEPQAGTWSVTDPAGALHYVVYSQDSIGNGGMLVPWIEIHALKEATDIKLSFTYYNGSTTTTENYTINAVTPKAKESDYDLYLKDDVNRTGRIIATLVDRNGNEVTDGLEGAAFTWSRDDGFFINPESYGDDYRSMNIAKDHGGLVEARMKEDNSGYQPTTYHVRAILATGETLDAEYTVYYQSEIINANFEFPKATQNYTFFPNGWAELYWKTTAPGTGANVSKDIEYGYPDNGGTGWGVQSAAGGKQFAELNAEEFGALYQDIISVPGEEITWEFTHAPRQNQNWGGEKNFSNAMFIVMGATENAQVLNQDDLTKLGAQAKTEANGNQDFLNGRKAQVVIYKEAEYYVWYHDAGTVGMNNNAPYGGEDKGWTKLSGEYEVPEGQYRTRLFFASEIQYAQNQNAGNLIDTAKAGQYKTYLIEYFLGSVDAQNQLIITRHEAFETGEALMYSSKPLEILDDLVKVKQQYLHKILINGENCPYNIRYADEASLFIQNYPRADDFKAPADSPNNYDDYDIVMQVYLREVVISVQTQLIFPGDPVYDPFDKNIIIRNSESKLTAEQKLAIIEGLNNSNNSYTVDFRTTSVNSGSYRYLDEGSAVINQRDPTGLYSGYYPVEEYPQIGHTYRLEADNDGITDLPGLKLAKVEYTTYIYTRGQRDNKPTVTENFTEFLLQGESNFAEIFVRVYYEELETTIHYQAVGSGKLAYADSGEFLDKPTETIYFYSELAIGAKPLYDSKDATFVGWFKDEACTDPVTAADGVWDKTDNSFRPNANIINKTEITFYAKFETGSIVITRKNANPGQVFVYRIQSSGSGQDKVDMYVTLQCDENGNGTVEVLEVPLNQTFTVTECEDWSWRHTGTYKSDKNSDTKKKLTFDFTGEIKDRKWLNGYSLPVKNIFKGGN